MHRLEVIYHQPNDPAAFDAHYTDVHTPLAAKIPGVRSFTTGRCKSVDGSPPAYYMVAELVFESEADFTAGLGSAEGAAAVADLPNFAGDGVTILHYEEVDRL